MNIFSRYIKPKIILNLFLGFSIIGVISILFTIDKMNTLLNTDLGFNKDSIKSIITQESSVILPDTLIFSSDLPGFNVKNTIEIRSEYFKGKQKIAHQYISDSYFDFFNYKKLNEKTDLFLDHGNAQLIYINEAAVKKLGICCIDDALGTRIMSEYSELVICGVVSDINSLSINVKPQAIVYQLNSEHLTYAFYESNDSLVNSKTKSFEKPTTFQSRIENRFVLFEDVLYSVFLFVNIMILFICLGFIGGKYASKKEKTFFTILGIGINVLTIIISKTYFYLIVIIGFVAGPLSLLIDKLWLDNYVNKVNFGFIDLFMILSIALASVYVIYCPKGKFECLLKMKYIQVNSK